MYKIIALIGEAGAGKDSMMQAVLEKLAEKGHISDVHEIVSCTSRPMREGEAHGINYYYYHPKEFEQKIMDDEMLEFTRFNNWWYGTSYDSVRGDGVINIGVFNPNGVRQLLDQPDCNVIVYWIKVTDKNRFLRQLNRENAPDVKEIVRRFSADYEDFSDIDFDYIEIPNDTYEDFTAGAKQIAGQVQALLEQGRN
jgi:guanylate kinase